MAETFNVTSQTTQYTWGNVPFAWGGCQKEWGDAGKHSYTAVNLSDVAISDKLNFARYIFAAERLGVGDKKSQSIKKPFQENTKIAETYWDVIRFRLTILESFKTRDIKMTDVKKANYEFTVLNDAAKKYSTHMIYDEFNTIECYTRKLIARRGFEENLKLSLLLKKITNQSFLESLPISDKLARTFGKNNKELALLKDSLLRRVNFNKEINEAVALDEFLIKYCKLNAFDTMSLRDAYIRACDGVLSNLFVQKKFLTADGFEKLVNSPSGYENFVDFKVGEYEYKDALVRILIKSSTPQTSLSAADVVMHVDIPDTDDRGTVRITDTTAATKVHFNKHYYNPPEVNVVLRGSGGTGGNVVPYIVSTDGKNDAGRYFEVELINTSGERTTGVISWVSKGY